MKLALLRLHFVVLNKIRVFVLLYGCSRERNNSLECVLKLHVCTNQKKIKNIYLIKQNQTPQIMNL